MNRDRSYYRKQRMRAIHRKETILRQLGGEEFVSAWARGAAGRPSSCWKSSNFSHEKTLPSRDRQTSAAPGQEAFLTPYLTTVRAGTRGNSGFKSVKKYLIPSGKCWKALQITTKNLVQAFGIFVQEKRTHSEKIIESPLKT